MNDYFDTVRNELDLFTETKISQKVEQESFWNERREKQIEVIRKIELAGQIKTGKLKDSPWSQVLSEFCFLLEYGGLMFVATVNKYVDEKEIKILRKLVEIDYWKHKAMADLFVDNKKVFKKQTVNFETKELTERFQEELAAHTAVVDMSWWFNREHHFDYAKMECEFFVCMEEFVSPLRIKQLEMILVFPFYKSVNLDEDKRKVIERIQNGFSQADSIVMSLRFNLKNENFSEKKAQTISSFVSSVQWNTRTTPTVEFEDQGSQRQYQDYCNKASIDSLMRRTVQVNNGKDLAQISWDHLYKVEFTRCYLDGIDFSGVPSLSSLKSCTLYECYSVNNFLDLVRANLEHLSLQRSHISTLSWKMFSGMTKLKSLELTESVFRLELDPQAQLFADLSQLKSLKININEVLLKQEWRCELPELEHLAVYFEKERASAVDLPPAKLRFKLPKLVSLNCNLGKYEKEYLAPVLADLSHAHKLTTHFSSLKQGGFRGFECSKLVVANDYQNVEKSMSADMFTGLESVRSIEIELSDEQKIENDCLRGLVNLQTFKLRGVDRDWIQSNHALFDGLRALSTIYLAGKYYVFSKNRRCLVHFENLNKFVMVYN